ncbi:MAG: M15 family metallopeptidase [Lachnospiraceae bacterium]|nr:M15 family metallopeptidase [Lachnospiraceae bacterium]
MKNKKRKLNVKRCFLLGVPVVAVVCVCTAVILLGIGIEKEPGDTSEQISEQVVLSEEPVSSSEKNINSDAESSEEKSEEASSSEEVTEEPSTVSEEELKQARIEEVVAGWETIPAGTVLAEEEVDLSQKSNYFLAYEISDDVYGVINGKSFQEGTEVTLADIRYIKVLHYNFEHKLQVGELIVATALQEDFINIFMELLDAEYEIQTMYLADNYWTGDPTSTDSASIDENNTSAFLYRPATGSSKLSKHAYGRAIDINPQQNPYVSYKSGSPVWSHENANDYIDRTTGLPHVITHDDVCYQIFKKYGFTWGGDWNTIKDYQHFEK